MVAFLPRRVSQTQRRKDVLTIVPAVRRAIGDYYTTITNQEHFGDTGGTDAIYNSVLDLPVNDRERGNR